MVFWRAYMERPMYVRGRQLCVVFGCLGNPNNGATGKPNRYENGLVPRSGIPHYAVVEGCRKVHGIRPQAVGRRRGSPIHR